MSAVDDSSGANGRSPGGAAAPADSAPAGSGRAGNGQAGPNTEDDPGGAVEREVLTWEAFGTACRRLAQAVADDGWVPDVVVAVARGGLTVAGGVAYALGVKNCGAMNVEFYTGVDRRLDVPILLPPTLDLMDVTGLRVLVVDDVADTGHTLRLVREVLAQHVDEARTAVLYHKPRSVVVPHYAWRRTDAWVVFPWSAEPPVTPRATR